MKKADHSLDLLQELGNEGDAEMPCAYPLVMNSRNRGGDAKARRQV